MRRCISAFVLGASCRAISLKYSPSGAVFVLQSITYRRDGYWIAYGRRSRAVQKTRTQFQGVAMDNPCYLILGSERTARTTLCMPLGLQFATSDVVMPMLHLRRMDLYR